ncbi:MAG TPA: hypothetical protein VKB92_06505 [Myxococcales bacterium]|nr:hypothetical protein [Myxococcales bacterium]
MKTIAAARPVFALTWAVGATIAGLALPLRWAAADAVAADKTPSSQGKADLARALKGTHMSLAEGFAVAQREGTPISGKYELERGALQLSVYTLREGRLSEVIVDYATGAVARVEAIEGRNARSAHAAEQRDAMAKARRSLQAVATDASEANPGFTVVSVMPSLEDGRPIAVVTLVRDEDWKNVRDSLDGGERE